MKRGSVQRFGAHLSVAGGLHLAIDAAMNIGADCLAIFVKNQRRWTAPPLTSGDIALFKARMEQTRIGPVFAHASYLLNLASPTAASRERSIAALVDELSRCEALGIPGIVVHPGAHMGDGIDAGIARIASSLDEVHAALPGIRAQVLLESTAGQGTTIGHEIVHLARMVDSVRESDRLGVCLDTCHLFAAGYDLRNREAYESMAADLEKNVGWDRVKCIHVNDSKGACGSRLDRHEHITKGKIGRRGFQNVLNDARLAHAPRILETPKGTDGRGRDLDRINLGRLRGMIGH